MAEQAQEANKDRSTFLIAMYNQLMADINRHIIVVWQSISILLGAFAAWSLIDKKIISVDVAVSLIIALSTWVLAHVYDAAYWYNRNLAIIANIERQFLRQTDLREIHYYFGAHRDKLSILTHFRLQAFLAIGVGVLAIGVHISEVLVAAASHSFEIQNLLPLVTFIVGAVVLLWIRDRSQNRYAEFLTYSPGKAIDSSEIKYGVGHPAQRDRSESTD